MKTTDYSVKGEMVSFSLQVTDEQQIQNLLQNDEIKKHLVNGLARELLGSKFIEFTKQKDMVTNITTFRARAFLLPDSMVHTMRVLHRNDK